MQLALLTTFDASQKESVAEVLERVHSAIMASGQGEPSVMFTLSDGPIGRVSSIDRVLKRRPELKRFEQTTSPYPNGPSIRVLTNRGAGGGADEQVDFPILIEIARGIPKSFPFHMAALQFSLPEFACGTDLPVYPGGTRPGIIVTDSWWVNGRQRAVTAMRIIDAQATAKKLPAPPSAVAAILSACGKAKSTAQVSLIPGMPANPVVGTIPMMPAL